MKQILILFIALSLVIADEPNCDTFENIYGSGTNLCKKMWGDAFVVVDDNDLAYTMWWIGSTNPNDVITENIRGTDGETKFFADDALEFCHLDYYHLEEPVVMDVTEYAECHPWAEDACCAPTTVDFPDAFSTAYGDEYLPWRCGTLSDACLRFFVYEACFYECDANIGLFRKWHYTDYEECCDAYSTAYQTKDDSSSSCYESDIDCNDESHNQWEVYHAPVQKDFCDDWYNSCRSDYFCDAGGGNFFECAAEYKAADGETITEYITEVEEIYKLSSGEIIGIVVGAVVFTIISGILGVCYCKAKKQRDQAYLQLEQNKIPAESK